MILTGPALDKAIRNDEIIFDPFDPANLNPNSINYRIGTELHQLEAGLIDSYQNKPTQRISFSDEGHVLYPGIVYLGHTYESIGSELYTPRLIGRSSLGRLGLYLQVTADLGQLGKAHQWTLELRVVQPLKIYPLMKIGQVTFWDLLGEKSRPHRSGYTQFDIPHSHIPQKVQ